MCVCCVSAHMFVCVIKEKCQQGGPVSERVTKRAAGHRQALVINCRSPVKACEGTQVYVRRPGTKLVSVNMCFT